MAYKTYKLLLLLLLLLLLKFSTQILENIENMNIISARIKTDAARNANGSFPALNTG